MNTNFDILDTYPNKIGNYQSNSLTSFLIEHKLINNSVENQQNNEDLIYKLMSNNITFANVTDFKKYLIYNERMYVPYSLSILLLSNMHFFHSTLFKEIPNWSYGKSMENCLFTYKVSKNLFERIKPFINTNYKIIESIDNENVIIYNQDILKGIPLVKFKLQDKILMYALDYDNWKYLLYTGKNISHIGDSKKPTDNFVVNQILMRINSLNESYVLPNYENSIKQIIRNYIKIHELYNMYIIHINSNNSKFLYEVYGENALIQALNKYTSYHPLTMNNLNYGKYFFNAVDLTKLRLIKDKKPTMVYNLIESYPSILYRLDKSYFDKFDFAFFIKIITLVSKQLKERNHPDYNLDLVKKALSIFENRRFENKIYKHYPKLKMFLLD